MNEVLQAIQLKAWYPAAALLLTLAIQVVRTQPALAKYLWDWVPSGWRWLLPKLAGAAVGFVDAFAAGQPLSQALLAALGGALGLGVAAMGWAAALKESPIPWDGGAGGQPRPTSKLPPLVVLMLAGLLLGSCANWKPAARTVNDLARDLCSLFFAESQGISVEQAAETACNTRDQLDPWLREILAAKQAAGAAVTK
jgi:hypothetical protein